MYSKLRHLLPGLIAPMLLSLSASAQSVSSATPVITVEKPMVTRAELEQRLRQIDQDLASPGYSEMLRQGRRAEGAAIRDRLENGDIRPGDRITMSVQQNAAFSREYEVTPDRTILLPNGDEISVAHLLRSELADTLTARFKGPYFVDPRVTASVSVRIQIMGAANVNGFFTAPATNLLSTVLMEQGGGIARNVNLSKSQIRRGDQVIVPGTEFEQALRSGRSLDALSVQAGDEIYLAEKPSGSLFMRTLGFIGAFGSAIFVLDRIGVF